MLACASGYVIEVGRSQGALPATPPSSFETSILIVSVHTIVVKRPAIPCRLAARQPPEAVFWSRSAGSSDRDVIVNAHIDEVNSGGVERQ
jgi:hypothetical protein